MKMDFTNDMQLVAGVVGDENAIKLIASLGGISVYIPRPDHAVICYYHERLGGDVKKTANSLGVSERTVYRALKGVKEDRRQLTIFDAIEREKSVIQND
ncbi:MAG TPA: Mor transcription activator family protein [Candidatus Limiplasma sp.]|nr:Mor transcription activator family protein [Candidatus Limiplasma sp.]